MIKMSSVTPRERHAVAKSLRYLADLPGEPLENDGQFIEVLKYWIFADFKRYSYDETFVRLADLIEPTCEGMHRREPDDIDGTPRFTIHCSDCGQLLDETSGIPHSPMYCPNCGTRIIRGRLYSQSEDSSEVVQD